MAQNQSYAYQNKFRLAIQTKSFLGKNIEVNIVSSPVPDISLGDTVHPTPVRQLPIPGDSVIITDLNISFLLSENLEEWQYLFKWITLLKNCKAEDIEDYLTDAYMMVLTARQNEIFSIQYEGVFPVSLSQIRYDVDAEDLEAMRITAIFKVRNMKMHNPNNTDVNGIRLVT